MKNKVLTSLTIAILGLGVSQTSFAQSVGDRFIGEVFTFAGNFCPSGTEVAKGQSLPVYQYQALFSLLGTTYGGDGKTNFNLPDLQGRSIVGVGQGMGLNPVVSGVMRGQESITLTVGQLPAHIHTVDIPVSANITNNKSAPDATFSYLAASPTGGNGAAMWSNTMTNAVKIKEAVTEITGHGQEVPTLPPQLGMMQCIVVSGGIYPSRP